MTTTAETVENTEIVLRWAQEVLNEGKVDVVDELIADDFTWRTPFSREPLHGPAAMKEIVTAFLAAFPDFAVEVKDVVAEEGKVALGYIASGTNEGEFMGAPPTRNSAAWRVQHIFTLRGGRVVEDVTVLDRLSVLEQLGRA